MFISTIFSFTILVATAAADLHNSCVCINGNAFNVQITEAACNAYNAAGWKWGSTEFANRCVANGSGKIAGNQWEEACKTASKTTSFPCPDGKGTCWASENAVYGSC